MGTETKSLIGQTGTVRGTTSATNVVVIWDGGYSQGVFPENLALLKVEIRVGDFVEVTPECNAVWAGVGRVTQVHNGPTVSVVMETGRMAHGQGGFIASRLIPLSTEPEQDDDDGMVAVLRQYASDAGQTVQTLGALFDAYDALHEAVNELADAVAKVNELAGALS